MLNELYIIVFVKILKVFNFLRQSNFFIEISCSRIYVTGPNARYFTAYASIISPLIQIRDGRAPESEWRKVRVFQGPRFSLLHKGKVKTADVADFFKTNTKLPLDVTACC